MTFEGGEGSGKSTQIQLLAERLRRDGHPVVTTREPGGSVGAEALRHVILSGEARALSPDLEPLLFAAARIDHLECVIRPALRRGSVVICDRFIDSTRVYQGVGPAELRLVEELERVSVGETMPDLTVVLDVQASEGLKRAARRRGDAGADRFESEALDVHERRRSRFLDIAAKEPRRCVVVDGSRTVGDVASEIAFLVLDRIDSRRLETGLGADGGEGR
ncbi:dTMP kinase [Aureimonas psammosilenae]|uniref:dTMP kinase n=1 Tax=Aureimonas psammosilenae TaxID=2495496 RepID=UPI0012610CA8|nr:dTMP kinase [Aureimonas psammosilenae]